MTEPQTATGAATENTDGFATLETQWAGVVDGFGAAFVSSKDPATWTAAVSQYTAAGLRATIATVNPANVSQAGYMGHEYVSSGVGDVTVVLHYSTGGDIAVVLADTGNPAGTWLVLQWVNL